MARARREVAVGVVRRPFGLRGEVFVHPDPDLADPFPGGRRYRLIVPEPRPTPASPAPAAGSRAPASPDEPGSASPAVPAEVTVAESYVHRGRRVVRFREVADRAAAAALRDAVLWRAAEPDDSGPDTWWTSDLLGRAVSDEEGRPLGTVAAVADGPAHDYLVVTADATREVLVPLVADLVTITADRITVRPPPGLFDPGDATDA